MAKQAGFGDQLFIAGVDISGDIGAVDRIGWPSPVLDVTAINAAGGYERIYAHTDGEISFRHFFNDAVAAEFATNKAKGSGADRVVCYFHGSTLGNMAAGLVAKQINFDWERTADGALAGPVQCLGNGFGLDYGEMLTAGKRTDASATNGTAVDGGAATALGLAAYIQVFTLTSGSPTVKIQDSADGSTDWQDVTGGTFGVVTAPSASRIVTSLTLSVRRYLRVVTTGTFSNLIFAVMATRYPYA